LYEAFTSEGSIDILYIIKGGPGCGKSSFMRSIAAALQDEGLKIELILCSGDPDSLDGIFIPSLKTAYLDGTAPHILEPRYAGFQEAYVNLGAFCDSSALAPHVKEVAACTKSYKELYAKAYNSLKAAVIFRKGMFDGLFTDSTFQAIAKRSEGIIFRELKKTGKPHGTKKLRFLSALSCKGYTCLTQTAAAQCSRLYAIDNEYGLAPALITPILNASLQKGYDVIACPSPVNPDITEHLLIPALSLGFVSTTRNKQCLEPIYKHIRLDALVDKERLRLNRTYYRGEIALHEALLNKSIDAMAEAKQIHDRIEAIYNPTVDFGGVYALAQAHSDALLRMR
jgi:hypothetical protein